MWSRIITPINRGLAQKSFASLQNRNFPVNASISRNKHFEQSRRQDLLEQAGVSKQEKCVQNEKLFRKNKSTTELLLERNDANAFGATGQIADLDDPNDEHYKNIPLRQNQLPQYMYENMVKKHIRDKQLKEAIDVVDVRMKQDRVQLEYYIYDLLIMECGRMGYTKKAFNLYNQMKKRGLKVTGPTYAALFTAVSNTIHPNEGLKLAENLRKIKIQNGYQTNEIIYNSMIKAFGRCGDIETAFKLVDEMKDKKLQLKIDTMNHLLQVCCSDKEYGFRHALLVCHKIYHRKLVPNVYSFNLMLRCTRDCRIGDLAEMKKVIGAILRKSKSVVQLKSEKNPTLLIEDKPSKTTNSNEVTENTNSISEKTNEVRDEMPNLLAELPHLGSIVQLSMVDTPEDRLTLLGGCNGLISEMEKVSVRPNVKTFSQLMDTIPSTREAEHQLIEKMREVRVRADTDFFNLLMKRRILRRDYDGAKQVLKMIDLSNLDPDIATYGIMAMGCTNRQQSQEFQQQLNEKGVRLNIETIGALMKNATYIKDYDYVIDILMYSMKEIVKPSFKFYEIVADFKSARYRSLQQRPNEEEQIKFNRLYRVYREWKEQMGLYRLSRDDVSKKLTVHPWKQLKEGESSGIEPIKNINTRRLWKRQHTLKKLNPTLLNRIDSQNETTTENDDK